MKFKKRVKVADVTAQELKEKMDYILNNEQLIKKELFNWAKKDERFKNRRNNTIQKLVDETYDNLVSSLPYAAMDSYSTMIGGGDFKKSRIDNLKKLVSEITDEQIAAQRERVIQQQKENLPYLLKHRLNDRHPPFCLC